MTIEFKVKRNKKKINKKRNKKKINKSMHKMIIQIKIHNIKNHPMRQKKNQKRKKEMLIDLFPTILNLMVIQILQMMKSNKRRKK